ncbi:MAG: hypothetical protein A2Y56_05330 [Candidatus Aminicenantes bacterium RBG_13_63_10]|nr:MAG: hypothetical protein A2Y56_05330 [Candidatus Aminicenantes bacterium RBG_13_63_10]
MFVRARGLTKRDSPEVEHGEDVAVVELVQQGETQDVEPVKRRFRLEGDQGPAAPPQGLFHVRPGSEDSLGGPVRHGVEPVIEDLLSQVGHADLVDVGKGQGQAKPDGVRALADLVPFAADVASGLLHSGEQTGPVPLQGFRIVNCVGTHGQTSADRRRTRITR